MTKKYWQMTKKYVNLFWLFRWHLNSHTKNKVKYFMFVYAMFPNLPFLKTWFQVTLIAGLLNAWICCPTKIKAPRIISVSQYIINWKCTVDRSVKLKNRFFFKIHYDDFLVETYVFHVLWSMRTELINIKNYVVSQVYPEKTGILYKYSMWLWSIYKNIFPMYLELHGCAILPDANGGG
jgi:hypothetical protein